MFGSDSFPLGPNGQFPRQRIATAGNELIPPQNMEETYLRSDEAQIPQEMIERDFNVSNQRVKGRMRFGAVKHDEDVDMFRPRYAPPTRLRSHEDEGEVDDNVGRVVGGRMVSSRMVGPAQMRGATAARPVSRSVIGSEGWLRGIQRLLGYPA